jgi:hypothetical protein
VDARSTKCLPRATLGKLPSTRYLVELHQADRHTSRAVLRGRGCHSPASGSMQAAAVARARARQLRSGSTSCVNPPYCSSSHRSPSCSNTRCVVRWRPASSQISTKRKRSSGPESRAADDLRPARRRVLSLHRALVPSHCRVDHARRPRRASLRLASTRADTCDDDGHSESSALVTALFHAPTIVVVDRRRERDRQHVDDRRSIGTRPRQRSPRRRIGDRSRIAGELWCVRLRLADP